MSYDVTIVAMPDGDELNVGPVTIDIDLDSWAITLQASALDAGSYQRIKPSSGEPGSIEAHIQGYVFEFLIDQATEKNRFNADDWGFSATSLTVRQGAPFARPRDLADVGVATVQQHALAELPLAGWSLEWGAPDWEVAAGAWSYQGLTPIQAISMLADAAGGALQSGLAGQALRVIPRYPKMPWELSATAPEYSIPLDTCLDISRLPVVNGTRPNAVYLHGGDAGGLLGRIVRSTTAGDVELKTVVNRLMTDSIGLRALGGRLLADQYRPPEIQAVTLPMGGVTSDHPMIDLGKIVALTGGDTTLLGIASAARIAINPPGLGAGDGPEITQTISFHGRAVNPWSRLRHLNPFPPLLVGTVVSSGTYESRVQMVGGGLVSVAGTASVGQRVYVRGDALQGPAPDLPEVDIFV